MLTMLIVTLALQVESRWDTGLTARSWQLLEDARFGTTQYERAAFATIDRDGNVEFVMWPRSDRELRADFCGALPQGTFAIVHTHPNSNPFPSANDSAVAARLGIRVYTLTRSEVTVTDGRTTRVVATGDWNPARRR